MSEAKIGAIGWTDLTVDDADGLRDFYSKVVGWTYEGLSMGDYDDYSMITPDGSRVAGVCHARGENAGIPPQWIIYVNVADMDASLAAVKDGGGELIQGPRDLGNYGRVAVIKDPAGAAMALVEPPKA